MAPEFLERLLENLPPSPDPDGRLLCGPEGNEDATVVRVPEGRALVQTVDILSPIGNDPYTFGQIAAANALSDVYAMGGEPWCAMNIAFFPSTPKAAAEGLGMDVLTAILRGGADKLHEAGGVLAGGHTVEDEEPKYGLSVTGVVDPAHVATNAGLCPGDVLILTKPLGTGILSTVAKAHWDGWEEAEAEFCRWASRLNRVGASVIRELGLRAATDITGFGLGGHALEQAVLGQRFPPGQAVALQLPGDEEVFPGVQQTAGGGAQGAGQGDVGQALQHPGAFFPAGGGVSPKASAKGRPAGEEGGGFPQGGGRHGPQAGGFHALGGEVPEEKHRGGYGEDLLQGVGPGGGQ